MAEENKSKEDQFIEKIIGKLRGVVQEEVQVAISKAVVPKGYERCPVCGEVIKSDKPCPYCEKKGSDEGDIFAELGIE